MRDPPLETIGKGNKKKKDSGGDGLGESGKDRD